MRQFIISLSLVLLTLLWCAPAMAQEGQTYGSDLTVSISQELIDADRESPSEDNPRTGGVLNIRQAGFLAAGTAAIGVLAAAALYRKRNQKSGAPVQGGKNKAQKE